MGERNGSAEATANVSCGIHVVILSPIYRSTERSQSICKRSISEFRKVWDCSVDL